MTILATHFSVVLGAWRIRVRFDIDEPRQEALEDTVPARRTPRAAEAGAPRDDADRFAPWGHG